MSQSYSRPSYAGRGITKVPVPLLRNSVIYPEGMPQNMDELARDYGKFIEKRAFNYTKIKRNGADLLQHIWVRLCEVGVLDKFVTRFTTVHLHDHWNEILSSVDMCELLGVHPESYKLWVDREVPTRDDLKWWPSPVELVTTSNGLFSRKSKYLLSDVITLAECRPFKHYEASALPWVKPSQVKSKFVGYLCQAIHNHYANFCRDHARHFTKEYVISPDSMVRDGDYFRRRDAEDGPSWEDLLPAEGAVGPEDILHIATGLRDACKQNGVNLETPEGMEIFEIVASGYTMSEAIEQVGYKVTPAQIVAAQR